MVFSLSLDLWQESVYTGLTMMKFTATNIRTLSAGLTALGLGLAGVLAFIPLMLTTKFFEDWHPITTLLGLELIVSLLMILVGPICCFFSPLKLSSKAKLLVTCLGLVMWARLDHGASVLALLISLLGGISFAYALCDELECPDIKNRLNKVILVGVSSPLLALLSGLAERLSSVLCWTGLTLSLVLLLLATVGSVTALLALVQRVRQLQKELPALDENHTGFSRF